MINYLQKLFMPALPIQPLLKEEPMNPVDKFSASVAALIAAYTAAKAALVTLTANCVNHDATIASQAATIDMLNKLLVDQEALIDAAVVAA